MAGRPHGRSDGSAVPSGTAAAVARAAEHLLVPTDAAEEGARRWSTAAPLGPAPYAEPGELGTAAAGFRVALPSALARCRSRAVRGCDHSSGLRAGQGLQVLEGNRAGQDVI